MTKRFVIAMTLAASCVLPVTGHAQAQTSDVHVAGANTRQLDPARRAWLAGAVSRMLGDDDGSGHGAGLGRSAGQPGAR